MPGQVVILILTTNILNDIDAMIYAMTFSELLFSMAFK
jgi:hypothetical protein